MTDEEIIAVVTARMKGKTIECCNRSEGTWRTCPSSFYWNFEAFNYRIKIKPEPHYRPFESAEEVMEAIKEHGDYVNWKEDESWKLRVIAIHDEHVQFGYNNIIDHDVALREWLFCDGTPFGRLVEE